MNNNDEHHDQLEVEELGGPLGPNFWALLLVSCFWPPYLSHIIPPLFIINLIDSIIMFGSQNSNQSKSKERGA